METEAIDKIIDNEKEWRRFLVKELSQVKTEQVKQGKSIASLNVKSTVWGVIGGSIPASAMIIVAFLKSKM